MTEQVFYVTYGLGSNLAGCYSEVTASTPREAREEIDAVTGGAFAFMYNAGGFVGQIAKYSLKRVPLQPQGPTSG